MVCVPHFGPRIEPSGARSDVRDKSFKQLDGKIKQIDQYKKGSKIALEGNSHVVDISQEEPLEDDAILQ